MTARLDAIAALDALCLALRADVRDPEPAVTTARRKASQALAALEMALPVGEFPVGTPRALARAQARVLARRAPDVVQVEKWLAYWRGEQQAAALAN